MKNSKQNAKLLFYAYIIALVWIILLKFSVSIDDIKNLSHSLHRNINLIPFAQSQLLNGSLNLEEIVSNIIIFIPFGCLLKVTYKRNFLETLVIVCSFSITIEILQFVFAIGATDITDIITNTIGGILGYGVYTSFNKIFGNKTDKLLVNVGIIIFVIFLVSVLFLVLVNL